jgi:hypothetical protein
MFSVWGFKTGRLLNVIDKENNKCNCEHLALNCVQEEYSYLISYLIFIFLLHINYECFIFI